MERKIYSSEGGSTITVGRNFYRKDLTDAVVECDSIMIDNAFSPPKKKAKRKNQEMALSDTSDGDLTDLDIDEL